MPKVKLLKPGVWKYKCECGCDIEFHSDVKPKRVSKCWECLEKNDGEKLIKYLEAKE